MNWQAIVSVFGFRQRQTVTSTGFAPYGGIALERNKPGVPITRAPIESISLAQQLVFPLLNYQRQVLAPMVSVGDQVFAGDHLAQGVLSSADGVVSAIEKRVIIHPSHKACLCVVVDTHKDQRPIHSADKHAALTSVSSARDQLDRAGISGLGGAGFSTSSKLASAMESATGVELLLINAVECEPMISCDEALIVSNPTSVIQAVFDMIALTACKRCVLAIEDDKPEALHGLRTALETGKQQSATQMDIELIALSPIYPSGAEPVLIQRITGQKLSAGTRAAQIGILCLNVATVLAASEAQKGRSLVSRIVSIAGNKAAHAMNVRVRLGTPVSHVLEQTGNLCDLHSPGNTPDNAYCVRAGGPLSGFELPDLNVPITATTNCISIESGLPSVIGGGVVSASASASATAPAAASASAFATAPAAACIRCSQCSDVCPMELLPQQLYSYSQHDDERQMLRFGLNECIECGCCDVVCPAAIPLTASFRHAKTQWREHQIAEQEADSAKALYEKRQQRLEQRERESQRLREEKAAQLHTDVEKQDPIAAAMARSRARRAQK